MMVKKLLFLALFSLVFLNSEAGFFGYPRLSVGAFNIENFGSTKSSNEKYLRLIAKIICRYDLMAVLEVQDSTHNSLDDLARTINVDIKCPYVYGYRTSPRSGSTSYKEQLVFFYRQNTVEPITTTSVGGNKFERPPFLGVFRSKKNPSFSFMPLAVHLRPDRVVDEMAYLKTAYNSAIKKYGPEHRLSSAFILGDLNCDSPYIRQNDWRKIGLAQSNYMWLISDGQDTMASKTKAAYDRIIMDSKFHKSFDHSSPHVFKYERDFWVNNKVANGISNHYPIGFDLIAKDLKLKFENEADTRSFWQRLFWSSHCEEPAPLDHQFRALELPSTMKATREPKNPRSSTKTSYKPKAPKATKPKREPSKKVNNRRRPVQQSMRTKAAVNQPRIVIRSPKASRPSVVARNGEILEDNFEEWDDSDYDSDIDDNGRWW